MRTEITLARYQKVNRELRNKEAKTGFMANFVAYIIINTVLVTVNFLLVPVFPWAIFPLLGWGFGVTMHYTFGVKSLANSLTVEEDKIEGLANER